MLQTVRSKEPADLTAVIEGWPLHGDKTAGHSYRILRDAEISMRPLREVDAFAASVREELTPSSSGAT